MRSYTAVALLLLALGQPLYAQKSAESVVRVREGAPLAVECEVPVERRAEWRVDGRAPAGDLRAAGEAARAGGAVLARLEAPAARARHAGRYTCSPGPAGDARAVRLLVLPATDNSSGGTEPPAGSAPSARDYIYDLGKFIALNCSSAVPELDSASYTWSKNGSALDSWADLRDRYKLSAGGAVLNVTRAYEADWGQYECAAGAGAGAGATVAVARWTVGARPIAKLPADSSVVEGQRLNLTCRVLGKPAPPVQWYYTESLEENATVHLAAERLGADRVTFSANAANVSGAVLVVEAARVADAGVYWCAPEGGTRAHTTLRVKDMYAALWPFLGICAEVFVLCAIILVYEKRRTKPELDDSDTDNHDQ